MTPPPAGEPVATAVPAPSAEPGATPSVQPTDASDLAQLTPDVLAAFEALVCVDPSNPAVVTRVDQGDPDAALVVCSVDGFEKYVLGPVEVEGERIADAASASAAARPVSRPGWSWSTCSSTARAPASSPT